MNNINRGVLIGIRIILEDIQLTLENISSSESEKEGGFSSPVPIEHRGETSGAIYDAAQFIGDAIELLNTVVPDPADFE